MTGMALVPCIFISDRFLRVASCRGPNWYKKSPRAGAQVDRRSRALLTAPVQGLEQAPGDAGAALGAGAGALSVVAGAELVFAAGALFAGAGVAECASTVLLIVG